MRDGRPVMECSLMTTRDPAEEDLARRAIQDLMARGELRTRRRRVYLVSYPRSGNTLARRYFAILQGRAQHSVYAGDVVIPMGPAVTDSLDNVDIIKSHQFPDDDAATIYLVRDGRNATLSFLYMTFLFGGHMFSELSQVSDAIRQLDTTEGSWADHVAQAHQQSERRSTLFVRYEDLISEPAASLMRMARFMNAEISAEDARACVLRQPASDDYANNPSNGYTYQPATGSIYDVLKKNRRSDYWGLIFDDRSKRYFHECGATRWLLQFGYERTADWWTR
jgi:hypothetical protein